MKKKKIISTLISAVMMMTASVSSFSTVNAVETGEMRDITTMELVRDMGVGINLGNTMESCGDWIAQWGAGGFPAGTVSAYETAWGSPVITQDMIKGYANEGFGVVRVPVAWSNLMGDNYQINADYIARVQQIVDWIIAEDMYAIINIHYDSGWLHELPNNPEGCKNRFKVMWEQICEGFKDYGDYLMFESQNEELGWDSIWNQWSGTAEQKAESYKYVNEVNQIFVDTVRASGGNNDERHLLISGYKTDIALTCDSLFEMPEDPMDRCAVSVHYYTPVGFAILEKDESWAECRETWGTEADFAELESNMNLMKSTYIDNGVPVIIGEYGCPKTLRDSNDNIIGNKDPESVRLFLSSVCEEAYERQLCPVLWDITDLHYDRTNCKMLDQELKANFNDIVKAEDEQPTTEPSTEPTVTTTSETTTTTTITTTTTTSATTTTSKATTTSSATTTTSKVTTTSSATTTTSTLATDPTETTTTTSKTTTTTPTETTTTEPDEPLPTEETALAEPAGILILDSKPTKTEYEVGEELDLTGLEISLRYYPGGEIPISQINKYTLLFDKVNPLDYPDDFIVDTSDFDNKTAGTYTIIVKHNEPRWFEYNEISFEVTVTCSETVPSDEIGTPSMMGDINLDNFVGTADVVVLTKYNANSLLYPLKNSTAIANADVNHDDTLDTSDTLKLIEYLLRTITLEDLEK
ncbi:MAG: cellulase family glycosylhydrolase [Oscillospiraceae bacterium]|nr:cellulase family glycosylhydrolase [Oscillospiraceae bacterium]